MTSDKRSTPLVAGAGPVPDDTPLERRLRPHRAALGLGIPAIGALALALARAVEQPALAALATFPPLLVAANVAMTLPLAASLAPASTRRTAAGLLFLALFGYVIEAVGVSTGWPYGAFRYAAGLDPLVLDLVPAALPLFWLPLLVNAYVLAVLFRPDRGRSRGALVATATLLAVLLDTILDPGAVALGFWAWDEPGGYYGVPLVNFAGWILSGGVGALVMTLTLPPEAVARRLHRGTMMLDTLAAFLVFWGLVNAGAGQWLPVVAAVGLGCAVVRRYLYKNSTDT